MHKSWPPTWLTPIPAAMDSRGDEVGTFIETFVRLTKDSIAGNVNDPMHLRDWQRELLRQSFALKPDGTFKHRTIYWSMARKNGKSALSAGVGLWSLFMHDEGGETYSCAATKDQARITFNDARKLVEGDPELAAMCNVYRDAIELPATGSVWRVLASDSYSAEGLNASCVIFDEIHALQDRSMWDVMQLSMASRKQPLMIATTTAGQKTDSTGHDSTAYQLYQYAQKAARGEVDDPSFFAAIWEAPAEADHRDRAAWIDGNPGFNDLNSETDFQAMVMRTPESEFRTKRCNQWVNSAEAWLPSGAWQKLEQQDEHQETDEYVLGFDGSWSNDSTAIVGVRLPRTEEDKPHVFMIRIWEKQPTDDASWRVPTNEVEDTIIQFCQDHIVREVAFDPPRWTRTMDVLDELGIPVTKFHTNQPGRMVPACQEFYDAVTEQRLTHDGDPVLTRHLDNAVIKSDRFGRRITKESGNSPRKIDAAVAAVVAHSRAIARLEPDTTPTPSIIIL